MSALFGKKDFRRELLNLIKKGDIKGACDYAIKNALNYEELGNFDEAILVLKTLVELLEENRIDKKDCFELALEKMTSLYIEIDEVDKIIENSIKLAKLKIELGKTTDAVQLLKIIDLRYKLNTSQLKEIANIYISIGHYPNALRLIDRVLQKEKDKELIKLAGDILFNTSDFEKALEYFKALSVVDPENTYAKKKIDEIEHVLKVLSKSNKNIESLTLPKEELKKEEPLIEEKPEVMPTKETLEKVAPSEEQAKKETREEKTTPNETEILENRIKEKIREESTIEKMEVVEENKVKTTNIESVSPKTIEEKTTKTSKPQRISLEDLPEYINALTNIEKGDVKEGVKLLETLALDFEGKDIDTAIEIYEKILLIDPANVSIARRISKILLEQGRTKEAIFYLRSASNSADPKTRLEALLSLKELIKDDKNILMRIFDTYIELGQIEDAIDIIKQFPEEDLTPVLEKLFNFVKDSINLLYKVSKLMNSKKIDESLKFKYFYRTYELLSQSNDKVESIKWLIKAHSVRKLALEDYLKGAEILKYLKLPEEAEVIARSIYEYIELQNDPKKAYELSEVVINLNVNKPLYYAKHLDLAKRTGENDIVLAMVDKLISHNAVQYAELVYDSLKDLFKDLDTQNLVRLANYFEVAGFSNAAYEVNLEILKKDPLNSNALAKTFIYAVEKGDEKEVLSFLDKFPPSSSYASIIEPVIEKYSNLKSKNPFDPTYHFIIGFLYFFIERYEEAVAYFQFVIRSNRSKPLMRLMLSICFEKMLLYDFALKQLELGITEDGTPEVKKELLYRYAVMKKNIGDVISSRKALTELLKMGDYKDAKVLLETLPQEGKIIDIRGEEK
ncbi:tetratricopeptide repeat protein [Caldisericum exile]|uniref:Tetratricopeptide repeat protein n=1 Tax=Caldisericum exile (strain DSM 21853 / NBRC 104410 / AZM16c01) TaxID=511051 RepID=A0A7U6GFY4_CALEA|nr:tetratricopeptide repeat protein [Caldisericum exile]BAL81597.1 hypothetical protein CSE_14710 [Caldisericum exile AZM16c01]